MKEKIKAIKVHDWQAVEAEQLEEGEQNAAVISFRIANIQGLSYFIEAFQNIKQAIELRENFSGGELVVLLAKAAGAIYSALKEAKISDKLN